MGKGLSNLGKSLQPKIQESWKKAYQNREKITAKTLNSREQQQRDGSNESYENETTEECQFQKQTIN